MGRDLEREILPMLASEDLGLVAWSPLAGGLLTDKYDRKAESVEGSRRTAFAPITLQFEYSLIERSIEREHIPAANDCGFGITPWAPLAGGFLAGSYKREAEGAGVVGGGRLAQWTSFKTITERHWSVLEALRSVASQQSAQSRH